MAEAEGQSLCVGVITGAPGVRGQVRIKSVTLPELYGDVEFYRGELIGLWAEDRAGRARGTVVAVENFGAGDVVEIERPDKATFMVPFTKAAVPEIDLVGGRLVIDPPEEIEAGPE